MNNFLQNKKLNFFIVLGIMITLIVLDTIIVSTISTIPSLIITTLLMVPALLLVLHFLNKDSYFVAFFVLFMFFFPNNIKEIFNMQLFGDNALIVIRMLIGVFAGIYALMMLYFARGEIRSGFSHIPTHIMSLIGISIVSTYFRQGFTQSIMIVVIYLLVLFTLKTKEVLPVVIFVYAGYILYDIYTLLINFRNYYFFNFLFAFINIGLMIFISYYALKLYRKDRPIFAQFEETSNNNFYS